MRKNLFILTGLIICTAFMTFGCRKEEVTPITVPDVLIEEIPSELPEEPTAEAPVTEEPIVKAPDEEYVHWSKLHDYHLDQQDLAADGEFKNLTLQLGSNPDELHITWFSKSGSTGKVKFEAEGMFHDLSAKAETRPSHAVPGYHRNSALIKGLEANTTYTYHLQNGSHKSSNYTYTTGNLYSTDFTFTIAGDAESGLGDVEEYDRIINETNQEPKRIPLRWMAWIGSIAASIALLFMLSPIFTSRTANTMEIAQCIQQVMSLDIEDMVSISATPLDDYVWVKAELKDGSTKTFIMSKDKEMEATSLLAIN